MEVFFICRVVKKMMNLDYRRITVATFEGLLIAYLILLILDYSDPGFVSFYIHLDYLLYLVIAFGVASFLSYTQEIEKSKLDRINRYVTVSFLCLLCLIILNQIVQFEFLQEYQVYLMTAAIAFGVISFWLNRDKINLEEELEEEIKEEEKRREEFPKKFPKISGIPVLRSIVKWMYKEGWFYSIALIALVIVGFWLRVNNLENLSLWSDEGLTILAARALLEKGSLTLPSGMPYNRSILTSIITSFSFIAFGISEVSARIPQVIFGTLSIPLIYVTGKCLVNKNIGFLAAIILCFSAFDIDWSRQARMYSQFQFLFLLLMFYFYRGYSLDNIKYKYYSFFAYIGGALTHATTALSIPVFGVFMFVTKKLKVLQDKLFMVFLAFGTLISLLIDTPTHISVAKTYSPSWAQKPFYYYITYLYENHCILFVFFVLGSFYLLLELNKGKKLYLFSIIYISILIISFITWRESRYLIHLMPFIYIISSIGIYKSIIFFFNFFTKNLNIKFIMLITIFFILLIIVPVNQSLDVSCEGHGLISTEKNVQNWKLASEYINRNSQGGDVLFTTNIAVSYYYFDLRLYFLRFVDYQFYAINKEGTLYDIYTGSIVINNEEMFFDVLKTHKRTWVVVERIRRGFLGKGNNVLKFIEGNMTYHPEGSDDTIRVYSWENLEDI